MARTPRKRPGDAFRGISDAQDKRRAARQSPFEAYAARPGFEWEGVNPATLCDGLHHALTRGVAITFSLTADGGAVKVTVWLDNVKHPGYAGDADVLNELMESLTNIQDAEDGPGD